MELDALDALLAAAKRPETTVPLCLRGDLQAEHETLDRKLSDLRSMASRKLAGAREETELAERIVALEREMADSTVTLRLRALPRREWRTLVEKHPPRKSNDEDQALKINGDTFFEELIGACLVEPALDADRLSGMLDQITDAQYDKLQTAAWMLNRRDVDVPFSPTASRITTSSDATSRRQSDSASRRNASQGGNRRKSPTTTTTLTGD